MSSYPFLKIEPKWQAVWEQKKCNKATLDTKQKKCYILDMFPYPSGAGLHVGHPLGYIASDIYARYKRLQGFNVLHPIGFDAFGLPAEQFAIEHGIHPKISTTKNIQNFRDQLKLLALSFDWDREVITCEPSYYKWTQWIFMQLYQSWYDRILQKARPIKELIQCFVKEGNANHPFPNENFTISTLKNKSLFTANEWLTFDEQTQYDILMEYRLAYLTHTDVNWCEALGTVLANDEVINGLSYRGGHAVTKKKMLQWSLRITEYADRLLHGLEQIEFSNSLKEIQRNWIGKSLGAEIHFEVENSNEQIHVFTTRPDTIFGVDFLVLAPEHELVKALTTPKAKQTVEEYISYANKRSEVDRMADTKTISGCFLGTYALHPITQKPLPIWISDYVLAHYGTGAIMAVPAGDQRDFLFARHFKLPISNIFGDAFNGEKAVHDKSLSLANSDFLNGLTADKAIPLIIEKLEHVARGVAKVNYKMRDAGWSRQRYWGEPFPVYFDEQNRIRLMDDEELPLLLPDLDTFHPAATGKGPLAHAKEWVNFEPNKKRDTNTMPTHAGAAWYFLRFTDPHNKNAIASKEALQYWNQVDLYIGGAEHAVAHLLYARMWVKVLYDLGHLPFEEPFKKLINQGKIMGETRFVYRIRGTNEFVSADKKDDYETDQLRVDISLVDGVILDTIGFKKWKPDFAQATFILNTNKEYICGTATEKMSKSYFNVVNPDSIIQQYGTDTLRMYEMFLGPLEDSKPWDTKNIEGTHRFLKRLWNWLHIDEKIFITEENLSADENKLLHQTIKKVQEDIERFSLNTAVSSFMSCLNEVYKIDCHKRKFLEPFLILLSSFAPHIAEELWQKIGNQQSVLEQKFPKYNPAFLKETETTYVCCINGKKRAEFTVESAAEENTVTQMALKHPDIVKRIEDKKPKKVIFIPKKMVNIVI